MKKILLIALAAVFCQAAFAQTRVTGTVTSSEEGNPPVSFATVVVKGNTSLITSTDIDGKFTLANVPGNAVLVFSSIGYTTQEVPVNGRSVVNVILAPDASVLDEVMVVAYGTVKKSTYTGSAAVVAAEKIKDMPVSSFQDALIGKVAGMQVTGTSGQAGSATNIRIRGVGSMNASNEPLYVIDGVPVLAGNLGQMSDYVLNSSNVMGTLNPNYIESITILKDAAASSLYGSRAANGVIVVTTKKGKVGKAKINFRSSVSFTPSFATDNWENATPEQVAEMYYELFWNGRTMAGRNARFADSVALRQLNNRFNKHGYKFSTTDNTVKTLKISPVTQITAADWTNTNLRNGLLMNTGTSFQEPITGRVAQTPTEIRSDANGNPIYFDWEKALLRTGVYQTYDLSVSGGTENTSVYSSIGYTKDKGRTFLNEYSRISGRVNLTQKVGKVAELATIVGISNTDQTGFNDTRNIYNNFFYLTRNMLWPMYWPTNFIDGTPWTASYGSSARNQVYYKNTWDNTQKTLRVSASEALTIKFMPSLVFRSMFSYDNTNIKEHLYYSALHWDYVTANGRVNDMRTDYTKWVSSSTLNFNESFADKHNVGVLVGFEAEKNTTDYLRAEARDLSTSTLQALSTGGNMYQMSGYSGSGHSLVSILSELKYNYDLKYFLSGSYRRDGSSRFGPANRWGDFWSVSGAWSINKEGFMASLPVVDLLRLRVAYGVNGTMPSSNYGWRSLGSYGSNYMDKPGGGLANIGNDKLTWESNYSTNVGMDFGLFKNRVHGTVEYFNRDTKDLLQSVQVSRVTGFSSTLQNVGEMNNRGLEIEIGGDIIRTKDWSWDISLSASFIKTKIVKLYEKEDIIWRGDDSYQFQYIYREGYSNLSFYGREWAGVDQTNGMNVWYTNNNVNDSNIKGFNKNVSYDYTKADEIILANMNPKAYGGINTNASWKNWSLGLNFMYKIGGHTYDSMSRDINDDGYYWERIMVADTYKGRWTYDKGQGIYPMRIDEDIEDAMQYSSRHINPASFLRLKNLSLSYTVPQKIVNKIGVGSARIYFNGVNLWTWSAYKLYDPEVDIYANASWQLPFGKTFTFGLDISF